MGAEMARTVKEDEYNAKRTKILDAALSLIYSKGYQQMSIQDILDALEISRGALYHYFESKQAILEALVESIGIQGAKATAHIVQDSRLTAIGKLRAYFEDSNRLKAMKREYVVNFVRKGFTDENALFRTKMTAESIRYLSRLFEPIIRQGIEEEVFTTDRPEQAAIIIAELMTSLADRMSESILAPKPDSESLEKLEAILNAYYDAFERILGAPHDSLKVFGTKDIKQWFLEYQQ
jgi:TetR/AcrR family transcriptional repressor of nem operon